MGNRKEKKRYIFFSKKREKDWVFYKVENLKDKEEVKRWMDEMVKEGHDCYWVETNEMERMLRSGRVKGGVKVKPFKKGNYGTDPV